MPFVVPENFSQLLAKKLCPTATPEIEQFLVKMFDASQEGHLCVEMDVPKLPDSLLTYVTQRSELPQTPLCAYQGKVYFQKNFVFESTFVHHYARISSSTPVYHMEITELDGLQPEQQTALLAAAKSSLTLITGGPGTGKTYTASRLIKAIQGHPKIILAAPTGKAASHLQKTLGLDVPAKTLHAWLSKSSLLEADLIVVDEASMIDVQMMARLFAAVPSGARLVLLGDKYQLPPVESGGVFADLCAFHPNTVELKTCLRTDLKEIIDLAVSVKAGDNILEHSNRLVGDPLHYLMQEISKDPNFRVLSPLRHGPFGVETLNALIYKTLPFGPIPIIITANDYKLELFNGETGVLHRQSKEGPLKVGDYALFANGRRVPALLLPRYEYAYCMSVHKSQGSEFERVFLLLPDGAEKFGREVLYTGITRAKKELRFWGKDEIILQILQKECRRLSGVQVHNS